MKKKHVVFSLCFGLIGIMVLSVVAVYLADRYLASPLNLTQTTTYTLEKGKTLSHLLLDLEQDQVINQRRLIEIYARFCCDTAKIHAGEYALEPGLTPKALLTKLLAGEVVEYPITLVEGWTFSQILAEFERHPKLQRLIPTDNAVAAIATEISTWASTGSSVDISKQANASPEGQFFPDTYRYTALETDLDILKKAYQRMQAILQEEWNGRQLNSPLNSPYEALILASIVEKETGLPSDRPNIAAVFINRLNLKMRLQSDPTTIFGLGDRYDGNIRSRDLADPSPYNTYKIARLPPTPIALPGRESIQAVLNPPECDCLYFVARGDGSSQFSNTLAEHNRAVNKYQRFRRKKNYQSAPVMTESQSADAGQTSPAIQDEAQ